MGKLGPDSYTFSRWWHLDELRKRLMAIKFEDLGLANLKPLQVEVAEELEKYKGKRFSD